MHALQPAPALTIPAALCSQLAETSARVQERLRAAPLEPGFWVWHDAAAHHLHAGVELHGLTVHYTDPILGQGLFATSDRAEGEVLGEYTGVVIPAIRIGEPAAPYAASLFPADVGLPSWEKLRVDASSPEHLFRYINHLSSHVSLTYPDGRTEVGPNVGFQPCFIPPNFHLAIICLRSIKAGDELRADYGDGYFTAPNAPRPLSRVYQLDRDIVCLLPDASLEDQ